MLRAGSGETREYGRSVGLLTISLATAGVLTYAFFAMASHTLDREDYGRVVVLWSAVFITVSVLFRPIEQLLMRTVAELDERGSSVRHVLRVAATIQLVLAFAFVAVAFALRGQIEQELFGGEATFFWLLLASVLAFGGSYFARGYMAGRRHMVLYGALLVVDAIVRLAFALALALGIASDTEIVALGIAVAPLVSMIVIPIGLRRSTTRMPIAAEDSRRPVAVEGAPEFTLAQGGGFAAAVLAIMLSEQALLNSGPLLAQADQGAAAAGYIFNVLMVARAPVVLFQAVAASLLPHLTRLQTRGDSTSRDSFYHSLQVTLGVIAAFASATCLGLLAFGPDVMQIAFGDKFEYDRLGLVLVGVGMGFYLSATTLNQAALAQGKVRRAAGCWLLCATLFVVWNLTGALDLFLRIEVGFAAGAALLCALLFVVVRTAPARPEDVPAPDSGMELELTAAAADEVG
ncbi:MAG: hypothetical protein QOI31_2316 [Solirubrobacterales bacterium]|jgi:O-antigen/teichoic acid export membrane protein|nr:hypothetical protein [Solirubrobacterales bacterium]